jgi:histone H3
VLFWYFLISLRATVPGLNLCGFLTPPVAGADFRAAFVASCFLGALPPVDLRAVCLVRAMSIDYWNEIREKIRDFVDLFCVWGK